MSGSAGELKLGLGGRMVSGIVRAGTSFWALLSLCVTGVFLMAWIGTEPASGTVPNSAPNVEEARAFTAAAEAKLLDLWIKSARASWVQNTYITDDTQRIGAHADLAVKTETAKLAAEARRFDGLQLPEDVARKLKMIRLSVDIPAPHDPAEAAELASMMLRCKAITEKGSGVQTRRMLRNA